ncbi:helix-turn-helix domain-containing protein [Pontibacillus sp. HMF3514]|uniref:helix-turn-helix domain-containing protein n=1 Tax=Pontibacillus sp. HMF3514 TaxID=2692425 RepID=UPI00131FA5CB|nr:helix-turn-helix domain-containing protein [Pontibacillus sp. HMF3514]QHE52554.1 hypothetical protein GS400_11150 [Pontibacillus sp. HMF3514]
MFQHLLIHSISAFKGERTEAAIYHMLVGKRSSQTFQDIHAYNLTSLFGICRSLKREELHQELLDLQAKGFILEEQGQYLVTSHGLSEIQRDTVESIQWLNGLQYHQMDQLFWSRFLLFVQTASNIEQGQNQFIPIDERKEILQWVKTKYQHEKHDLQNLLDHLYNEIHDLFSQFPSWLAEFLTQRMTGVHRYGLSKEQLAFHFDLKKLDVDVYLTSAIHFLLHNVLNAPQSYPFLFGFCNDLVQELPITQSAKKTLELLRKGHPFETITRIRRLKTSTIQDHVVEIALVDPSFSVEQFVSTEAVQNISRVANHLNTNKLKVIKEALEDDYSYFQIRLVLASQ